MKIDAIKNGLVIDHIRAGRSMDIYRLLGLDTCDGTIALIKNVGSKKMGRKDIIKIDGELSLNLDILGFIDPEVTVNIIRDEKIVEKKSISLPERLTDVIKCKNPRCITTTEQELPHVFTLTDRERRVYRCLYCEAKADE
ncbi:MAG: aspartate carbamoyltransferase regulatory subunit [Clostridia bacterium]|nr:aspartate carbamoyltransferase regulatory subunit [Clostridia bacterium]